MLYPDVTYFTVVSLSEYSYKAVQSLELMVVILHRKYIPTYSTLITIASLCTYVQV